MFEIKLVKLKKVDSLLGQKTSRGSTHRDQQFTPRSSERDRECYDVKVCGDYEANESLLSFLPTRSN